MVAYSSVPTALNFLALLHCDMHDVHFNNIYFAAVLKRRSLDSARLIQGPTLHHQTRESTYFQRNVSKYAHVLGLKMHEICQVRAPI
jgi:hypothetical protein